MSNDIWHYPRKELAKQILGMFETGLSSALVFFAPRRMGKTQFLLKDMTPLANQKNWGVLYFSFLDSISDAKEAFTTSLLEFAAELGAIKPEKFQKIIKGLSAGLVGINTGIEFQDPHKTKMALKKIMTALAKQDRKILLLLDEVQALSKDNKNQEFIATLRTALDINKDSIKVIFTGSSQEGLRKMFSKSDAPFFHFGQNLPFPELEQEFTEHLTGVFKLATKREIDAEELWRVFNDLGKVPQLIRSLVERLVLHPNLNLQQAKQQLLKDLTENREYASTWYDASVLERLVLARITKEEKAFFSEKKRQKIAQEMGIEILPVSTLQSSIRSLQNKNIIGRSEARGTYLIDDPNFKNWIESLLEDAK